jgi:hypothetical protein
VWFPYLRIEARRDFIDLRSQFLLQDIFPSNPSRSWCDPTRRLKAWPVNGPATASPTTASPAAPGAPTERAVAAGVRPAQSSSARLEDRLVNAFRDRLLGNFLVTKLPAQSVIGIVLLFSVLASLVLLSVTGSASRPEQSAQDRPGPQKGAWRTEPRGVSRVVLGAVVLALAIWVVLWHIVFDAELTHLGRGAIAIVVLGGVGLIFPKFTAIVDRLLKRGGVHIQSEEEAQRRRLVVLALVVPWLLLFAAAEPGIPERFLWLWPLQVLLIAALFTLLLTRLGVPRPAVWLAQALLIFVVLWNSFLASRVDAWRADGWSGRNASEVRVADYVAADMGRERRDRASIGYQLFIYPFMADYHSVSSQYKVGAEFDVLFNYRHGIENTDTCAEGVSPRDDYRIVQTRPIQQDEAPRNYFEVPLENRFKLVREIGPYQVFKATQTGKPR